LISGIGTQVAKLYAQDVSGNRDSCSFQLNFQDISPPNLVCPGNQTLTLNASCQSILPNYIPLSTASDNCNASPTRTQAPASGTTLTGAGTSTVVLTANDGNGNTSTCSFSVTRVDNTAPTISCPGNQTLNLNASCQGILPDYIPLSTVSDNCNASPTRTQAPASGTTLTGAGTSTVVLTANDGNGNTSTCSFTVTRVDNTAPTISCPGNQTLNLNASCQGILPDYIPLSTVSDNCNASPSRTQAPASGTTLTGAGTSTVVLTANDGNGNTSSCSFTVTRVDNTAPTISCPGNQTLNLNASCQGILPDYIPLSTVSDNCNASPTRTQAPASGTTLTGTGVSTVVLTANDGNGNTSTCSFTVTRVDNTAPTISCPGNQTLNLNASCQGILPDYIPLSTVSDNCNASPSRTQTPASGTTLTGAGTSTVVLTANDGNGNTSTCSFTVTRIDNTAPNLTCPGNLVLSTGILDCEIPVSWIPPAGIDNCGIGTLTSNHTPGDSFTIGTSIVNYTASDLSGNTSSCSFAITINGIPLSNTINTSTPSACEGDTVTLTTLTGMSQYIWSTGLAAPSAMVTTSGWYWVDLTAPNGCEGRDSILISFLAAPLPTISQIGNQVCTDPFVSYQWFLNGLPIPGETNQCTPIGSNGDYSVQVTAANGCIAIAGPLLLTNVADANPFEWLVYPVPAQDHLFVELKHPLANACTLTLYDLCGRSIRIWQFPQMDFRSELHLDNVSKGTYLLEFNSDEVREIRKVILN
jgi:hypothetical protein